MRKKLSIGALINIMLRIPDFETKNGSAYREKLASAGFSLYVDHSILDSDYATYTGDSTMIHAYYASERSETRILFASIEKFVKYPLSRNGRHERSHTFCDLGSQ